MKTLYIDCAMGAAGDMLLAADADAANAELIMRTARNAERRFTLFFMSILHSYPIFDIHDNYTTSGLACQYLSSLIFH